MLKRLAVGLSLALFGCVFAVLLLESFLRISHVWIGRHSDTLFTLLQHDDTLGWRMQPGEEERVDFVDVEGIPVHVNRAGFWDREFSVAKSAGICRIACLGDSFTWGLGVREGQRFSDRLEAENPTWETLNFGVPGYGADQSVLLWHRIASRYKPDVVILTVYQNDYVDDIYQVRYGRRKPYFVLNGDGALALEGVPVSPTVFWDDGVFNQTAAPYRSLLAEPTQTRSRVLQWLVKNSDAVRLAYTILRDYGVDAAVTRSGMPAPGSSPGPDAATALGPAERTEIRLLSALVDDLAKSVAETGAHLLVVLAGGSIPQYEAQKKRFDAEGIAYVDATTGVLAAKLGGDASKAYFPYNKHWTPAAHRVVADLVAGAVRRMRLCDPAPANEGRAP